MVDKALEAGLMDNHCEPDEKEKISKKTGEDKLVSAYNVLRIHQFLGKYESDLNVRRSRSKPAGKKKISVQQREEREAAIEHLVARMHPKPPQTDEKQKESPEVKAARKKKAKENKELINHFLENYTEDMHKRRLHIKQVRFSLHVCLCRAVLTLAVQFVRSRAHLALSACARTGAAACSRGGRCEDGEAEGPRREKIVKQMPTGRWQQQQEQQQQEQHRPADMHRLGTMRVNA
jgi:hypothetical protein